MLFKDKKNLVLPEQEALNNISEGLSFSIKRESKVDDFFNYSGLVSSASFLRESVIDNLDNILNVWDGYATNKNWMVRYASTPDVALKEIENITKKFDVEDFHYFQSENLKEINLFEKYQNQAIDFKEINDNNLIKKNALLISGLQFLVSEEGNIAIVENGNHLNRYLKECKVQIYVAGIEQVVRNYGELEIMSSLYSFNKYNKSVPENLHILEGNDENPVPIYRFIILIDNFRTDLLNHPIGKKAMVCIHCDACNKVCPISHNAKSENFGKPFKGPIGLVKNPLISNGLNYDEVPYASTLCGKCADVCPVGIDIPNLLIQLRQQFAEESSMFSSNIFTKGLLDKAQWFAWQKYMINKSTGSSVVGTFKSGMYKSLFGGIWDHSTLSDKMNRKSFSETYKSRK